MSAIEFIWDSLEKDDSGNITYKQEDIDHLWDHGFVDTEKFSQQDWLEGFKPFKQKDGNYRLSKGEFLTLEPFRYSGPNRLPFEPRLINEGKYSDQGFQELVDASIAPSISLAKEELQKKVENLKKKYREKKSNLIIIAQAAKEDIQDWLDEHPSPIRQREILYESFLKERGLFNDEEILEVKLGHKGTAEQLAAMQASTFSELPLNPAEARAQELDSITKTKLPEDFQPEQQTVDLKSLRRNKKGPRG